MKRIRKLVLAATLAVSAATGSIAEDLTAGQQAQKQLVPESMMPFYEGFQHTVELYRMAGDWTPPKAPYQFCYNESYMGNSWRNAILEQLKKQVAAFDAAGLSKGELIVTNSNGDINLQLTQLNSLVSQGCDVIFSVPTSPTALCRGVKEAAAKGVLFITLESPVLCPEAINVAQNAYLSARANAKWLAEAMGEQGNMLIVQGMTGNRLTDAWRLAIDDVLGEYPDIKIAGQVPGNWTASVAKTEVLKFLATHPQQIDGVWSGGLMAVSAIQALTQAGRKAVPISDMDNECNWIAYMKENADVPTRGSVDGGSPVAYLGFSVANRILAGQRLAVNTILYVLPEITAENLGKFYNSSMTLESTCWADPADGRLVPDSYLDAFFTGGSDPKLNLQP